MYGTMSSIASQVFLFLHALYAAPAPLERWIFGLQVTCPSSTGCHSMSKPLEERSRWEGWWVTPRFTRTECQMVSPFTLSHCQILVCFFSNNGRCFGCLVVYLLVSLWIYVVFVAFNAFLSADNHIWWAYSGSESRIDLIGKGRTPKQWVHGHAGFMLFLSFWVVFF